MTYIVCMSARITKEEESALDLISAPCVGDPRYKYLFLTWLRQQAVGFLDETRQPSTDLGISI